MHCSFSTDSDAAPETQVLSAIEKGLTGITFTDHLDPDFPDEEYMFDRGEYFDVLLPLKAKYKGKIEIYIGVEIGLRTDQKDLLQTLANEKPYDFIVGSVHVVDGFDPYYKKYWDKYGTEVGLRRYFETMAECVEQMDFYDSLGHIDYIYRYAPDADRYPIENYAELIDRILKVLIQKNKALELNTAGWKYDLEYPHPCPYILKRYRELGGRIITLGSDAHAPEHIGFGFDKVKEYLFDNGFIFYVRYEDRLPAMVSLNFPLDKKIVVFDMDGTILDTLDDLYDSVSYALSCNSLPSRTKEEIRSFLGNGSRVLIEKSVPAGSDEKTVTAVHASFTEHYLKHCADKTRPYEGIKELLYTLKGHGVITAVVSNKPDAAVKELSSSYFPGLFDLSVGASPDVEKKPAPGCVNKVLAHFGMDKRDAVYIGDSEVDLATAKNADIDFIGVTWGFRGREVLEELGAEKIIEKPDEVLKFV